MSGVNQLAGTAFVDFQNDTGAAQIAKLVKSTTLFVNGAKMMEMTTNMQWSAANPGTPNEIAAGTSNGVLYSIQPGGPAPAMNPCDFCPFVGGNGSTLPTVTMTLEWDVNGTKVTAVSKPELKSCL